MITREQALQLIKAHVENKNIVKHMFATEAVMRVLAQELKIDKEEPAFAESFGEAQWGMAGLLHDGDYCESVPVEKQGIQITEWAEEKYDPPPSSKNSASRLLPPAPAGKTLNSVKKNWEFP